MKPQHLTPDNAHQFLNPADKNYCEQLHNKYWSIVSILANIYENVTLDFDNIKKENNTTFIKGMQLTEKLIKTLSLTMTQTTEAMIREMEKHFKNKYKCQFHSLLDTTTFDSSQMLTTYNIVVHNLLTQIDYTNLPKP